MSEWITVEPLIETWHRRTVMSQRASHEAAIHCRRLHYAIGIPAAALSALVSVAIFKEMGGASHPEGHLVVGGMSALAAFLGALQTFLGYSKQAEKHHMAAAKYGMVRRKLEEMAALPPEARGHPAKFIEEVRKDLDQLALDSLEVPNFIFSRNEQNVRNDPPTPLFHKPVISPSSTPSA